MSIDLRLSDVDPPASEPSRTIYRDINNLPDPVQLGITARYFNHDSVTLYFQLTGSATGYTFGTVNLGSLAAGTDAYQNCDQLASRAKPSTGDLPNGEMEETVTLTLKAYTDAGYSNLKWTFSRNVTVHWINSADPAWTVDVLNNFDDGTVQGWSWENEENMGAPTVAVATDYVLSPPYSLKATTVTPTPSVFATGDLVKSIATPDKSSVYAIIDARFDLAPTAAGNNVVFAEVRRDSTVLIHLGAANHASISSNQIPLQKWIRIITPLPRNTSLNLKVKMQSRILTSGSYYISMWLDDFKLISK
jgi:hypothetical protein